MNKRISRVGDIRVISLIYSSIIEIGDAVEATPNSRALAVQKEGAIFTDRDFPFNEFPVFTEPYPYFSKKITIDQERVPCNPYIDVKSVHIEGISSSSILQVGNLEYLDAESRVKHFRILREENDDHTDENEQ
ncbi:spore germination protein GerPE [Pontibacillus sp. HMF3514]|uniref:spore germination protein GerPE n=1 Tax=Pontibacillus sp. HMF3514 TaxID=2692425 RepID=UPI00131FD4E5|nr:spore germination protein GerPE [Pontibacillus sp. HMF3514]QHE51384.1 spore germination protein GerPE [Pontibacillus sp. HMF3514]